MDKVRIGIIGLGAMGLSHSETFFNGGVDGSVLSAVCDADQARLLSVQEKFRGVKVFSSAADMYSSGEIDAVVIATPHYSHPSLAIEAFEHKIHVMCEKPAGVYTKNVREINEKAAESGLAFGLMFCVRTNPLYIKMREMVVNGELGELMRTNWIITNWFRTQYYYDSGDWRATWAGEGGGVLLNQCPHNLDLWQWICGMPDRVTAFCHEGKWHNIEVEDDVTAYVTYPNGATGVFVTSTGDAPGTDRFEITGDKGKLVCENGQLIFYKLKTPVKKLTMESKQMFIKPEYEVLAIPVPTDGGNMHTNVFRAFVSNILRGEPMVAHGAEGIKSLMLSNAFHLSSWLKKEISLPIDEELFLYELDKRRCKNG